MAAVGKVQNLSARSVQRPCKNTLVFVTYKIIASSAHYYKGTIGVQQMLNQRTKPARRHVMGSNCGRLPNKSTNCAHWRDALTFLLEKVFSPLSEYNLAICQHLTCFGMQLT